MFHFLWLVARVLADASGRGRYKENSIQRWIIWFIWIYSYANWIAKLWIQFLPLHGNGSRRSIICYTIGLPRWHPCLCVKYRWDVGWHWNGFYKAERIRLKTKPKKCHFIKYSIVFLSHVISAEGIFTNPEKMKRLITGQCQQTRKTYIHLCDWCHITTSLYLNSLQSLNTYIN